MKQLVFVVQYGVVGRFYQCELPGALLRVYEPLSIRSAWWIPAERGHLFYSTRHEAYHSLPALHKAIKLAGGLPVAQKPHI